MITVGEQVVVGFNRPQLERLLEGMGGRRRSLGLRVADARSLVQKVPSLAGQEGAYVGVVNPGSPAAVAGVRPGDVIVAIDGRRVTGAADLEREVARSGPRPILTVLRDGGPRQIEVSL